MKEGYEIFGEDAGSLWLFRAISARADGEIACTAMLSADDNMKTAASPCSYIAQSRADVFLNSVTCVL